MKSIILVPIIIGSVLLVAGGTILTIGLVNSSKNKQVVNSYEIKENVKNFNIDLDVSDITFVSSTDGSFKVECQETKKLTHSVKAENETLTIKSYDSTKWYERAFNFDFTKKKVTVYMPEGLYGEFLLKSSTGDVIVPHEFSFNSFKANLSTGKVDVKSNVTTTTYIETSTGSIHYSNADTQKLDIKASTGDVYVTDVNVEEDATVKTSTGDIIYKNFKANNFTANASTGKVILTNAIIKNKIGIETSTGSVKFYDCDADSINVKTSTGDVKGTFLTDKVVYANTKTGKVNVPHLTSGGLCEITTDTGDIDISIK